MRFSFLLKTLKYKKQQTLDLLLNQKELKNFGTEIVQ